MPAFLTRRFDIHSPKRYTASRRSQRSVRHPQLAPLSSASMAWVRASGATATSAWRNITASPLLACTPRSHCAPRPLEPLTTVIPALRSSSGVPSTLPPSENTTSWQACSHRRANANSRGSTTRSL